MKIIGITGCIASGKTRVVQIARVLRIPVFISDCVVSEYYLQKNSELVRYLKFHATEALNDEGLPDRSYIRNLCINKDVMFDKITNIIHQYVYNRLVSFVRSCRSSKIILLEIPLLFETEMYKMCDICVNVSADEDVRFRRALKRKMSADTFYNLDSRHYPDYVKCIMSDVIIDNNLSLSNLLLYFMRLLIEVTRN